jgi:hypothetical protein
VSRQRLPILVAACVLPRPVVLLHERAAVLENMEKSDPIARLYLKSGTFGYVPASSAIHAAALRLVPDRRLLAGGEALVVGRAAPRTLVAVATAIVVYESGRRFPLQRRALLGAVIATLQPYLIWHDLRQPRDPRPAARRRHVRSPTAAARRSLWLAAALGSCPESRSCRTPGSCSSRWRSAATCSGGVRGGRPPSSCRRSPVAVAPWVVRNKVRGRLLRDHDRRPRLWKANNLGIVRHLRRASDRQRAGHP